MTRTDHVASSRPQTEGAALSRGSSRTWRRLSVVPIAMLLSAVLLVPDTAFAAEATSGYSQTAPAPQTTPAPATTTTPTTSTPTTPSSGTSPSKEEKTTPEKTTPSKETAPTSTTSTSKETKSTLPFTGFDLRWSVGGGLLLIGTGFSLVMIERRHRRRASR